MSNLKSKYFFGKYVDYGFEEAIERVTAALKHEGFGVLTEFEMSKTFKEKLGVEFKRYKVLGACHPQSAYRGVQAEDKLGVLLPCNVIIEEHEIGSVEVTAVDPVVLLQVIDNAALADLGYEIRSKMVRVIDLL